MEFGFGDFGLWEFWILGILEFGFWGFWILGILDFGDFGAFGEVPGDLTLGNLVTVPGGQRLESPLVRLSGTVQNQLYLI